MIPTSAVFRGTARITITGLLTVSFFKKAAVDHAAQVIHTADKVTIVTIGLAAADLCLSTAILILASDRTARKLISGDFNQSKENSPSLPSNNMTDTSSPPTSPPMDSTPYITPFTGTTPVPRQKRLSMESHTTLVADDDVDDNNSSESDSGFFVNESKKPPDTERILKRRQQQHRVRLRAARARSYIGHLEQLHGEILVDQMALVDGWADAMAKLGLTSIRTSASLAVPYDLGNIVHEVEGHRRPRTLYLHAPPSTSAIFDVIGLLRPNPGLLLCPLRPGALPPEKLKATAQRSWSCTHI
ncbi:hypothetical protein DEU56DRAFT_898830 [Suillus clintonianus]|uniref:uncharacterized protein n=1 Tax=Suillus clintonianus TaxID=1904413 RepID=UPI001B871114|nr:uncharacterized protein DEU56DRAFT_898830 [Suillus clintonianus]KAG2150406.1 hypothetical protein DEU56DRAFT_898830 [Suillus clintonianus]